MTLQRYTFTQSWVYVVIPVAWFIALSLITLAGFPFQTRPPRTGVIVACAPYADMICVPQAGDARNAARNVLSARHSAVHRHPRGQPNSMSEPLKYVILRHEGVEEPHFDLMFETKSGSDLATWRTTRGRWIRARDSRRCGRIGDPYLQYEGQISGDRGMVNRVHVGNHVVEEDSAQRLVVKLENGQRLELPKAQGKRAGS